MSHTRFPAAEALIAAAALSLAVAAASCGNASAMMQAPPGTSPGGGASGSAGGAGGSGATAAAPGGAGHVYVVALENHDRSQIYGSASAPYINGTLMPDGARADNFADELPALDSEPHYVWMEAGTNAFGDHTFDSDDAPSAGNSTDSAQHLVAQIRATGARDWMAYVEGLDASGTGACPTRGFGFFTPSHDPFVFFQDVAGTPPAADDAYCAAHHRSTGALPGDVAAGAVKDYNFITPDVCHDMHGGDGCPAGDVVRLGDDWLRANLPPLIEDVNAHGGVVFVVWDESGPMPFLAIGPDVKRGYAGQVAYDHGSVLKSVELMLGLPVLPTVARAADLGDLFQSGALP
jgi:hypothetical protein